MKPPLLTPVFRQVFDGATVGLGLIDQSGGLLDSNQALAAILGYERAELAGKALFDFYPVEGDGADKPGDLSLIRALAVQPGGKNHFYRQFAHRDGRLMQVRIDLSAIHDDGHLVCLVVQIEDVTDSERFTSELNIARSLAETTLSSIADGIVRTDGQGLITLFNAAAQAITGQALTEVLGRPFDQCFEIVPIDDQDPMTHGALPARFGADAWRTVELRRRSGAKCHVDLMRTVVPDGTGKNTLYILRDVSAIERMAERVRQLALFDPLTGLRNRDAFTAEVETVIGRRGQDQRSTLFYIDLDRFKLVNDRWGYAVGDGVLCKVCGVLLAEITDGTACRFSGDTLVLLLHEPAGQDAAITAERLRRAVADHHFIYSGHSFEISVSIGFVGIETADDLAGALSKAGAACSIAKASGRNQALAYQPNAQAFSRYFRDIEWIDEIKRAIAERRVVLYGQKIMQADQKTVAATEILVRLYLPNGVMVPPVDFISALERFDMSDILDRYVVENAIAAIEHDPSAIGGPAGDRLFVNLSGASLSSLMFRDWLFTFLVERRWLHDRLVFEITETYAILNTDTLHEFAIALAAHGVFFAIDDFGSGFANLGYVRSLAAKYLKIDGRLSTAALADGVTRKIVETICAVAPQLGVETIVEHIESDDQGFLLASLGANMLQGYALHRPAPWQPAPADLSEA